MILDDIARCRDCGAWTTHAHGRCTPCEANARQQATLARLAARTLARRRLEDTLDRLALAHLHATLPARRTRDRRPTHA